MANCKSELGLRLVRFDLNNREDIIKKLREVIEIDGDLYENEEYFSEDTLELGYENEAERIVDEATKGKHLSKFKVFERVLEEVWSAIDSQEYWGVCDTCIENMGNGIVMVAFAWGGSYRI